MQDKDSTPGQDSSRQDDGLPFFARFLEGQRNPAQSAATRKYPSDWDEMVTQKYPSDDDEGDDKVYESGFQAGGASQPEQLKTLKYPSDRDEIDLM